MERVFFSKDGVFPDHEAYKFRYKTSGFDDTKSGYRLPTDQEWAFACKANASTGRSFGSKEDRLPQYAWYSQNADKRIHQVGLLKPNESGLFDMLGNVREVCLNYYHNELGEKSDMFEWVGGCFDSKPAELMHEPAEGIRFPRKISISSPAMGFRLARTYPFQ